MSGKPSRSPSGSRARPVARNAMENITIRRLKLLEAVARHRNYTHAAREMNMAQASAYMQIRHLETAVGLTLLERQNREIVPTDAGEKLLDAARDILSRLERLRDDIDSLNDEVSGSLDVAVVTSAKYFLPHYLGQFTKSHPRVHPRLKVTNRANIIDAMRDSQHDLYVMGQIPDGLNVVAKPFRDNILEVMAPPDHPLQAARNISLKQLAGERFLVRERGSGTRTAVDRLFARKKLAITPFMELGSGDAITNGVIAGLGIAVLSRHSLKFELQAGVIRPLDVEGFPLHRKWYVVYPKGRKLSRAARTFMDYLLTHKEIDV